MTEILGDDPMNHIKESQLKIIDFNHSRMFCLDDSPFRIRKRRRSTNANMTEMQVWQEMIELPSPMLQPKSPTEDTPMASFQLMAQRPAEVNQPATVIQNLPAGQRFKMFSPRVGTPMYRAPEILKRGQMYSESIDLWSAGCCIYYMLVGKALFPEVAE